MATTIDPITPAFSIETARWFMGALMLGLLAWVIEGYSKTAAWGFVFIVVMVVIIRNKQGMKVLKWIFHPSGGG